MTDTSVTPRLSVFDDTDERELALEHERRRLADADEEFQRLFPVPPPAAAPAAEPSAPSPAPTLAAAGPGAAPTGSPPPDPTGADPSEATPEMIDRVVDGELRRVPLFPSNAPRFEPWQLVTPAGDTRPASIRPEDLARDRDREEPVPPEVARGGEIFDMLSAAMRAGGPEAYFEAVGALDDDDFPALWAYQMHGLGEAVDATVTFAREVPVQAAAGVRDAVVETTQTLLSLGQALENAAPGILSAGGGLGLFTAINRGEGEPADLQPAIEWLDGLLPGPPPETIAGGFVRGLAQFLTGFVPAVRLVKAVGVTGLPGMMAGGAIADATVFDPQMARLSNLWQEMGLPQNALTDFLATEPGDSEAEGRLSNVIEGAALGAVAPLVAAGARVMRAARRAMTGGQTPATRPGAAATAEEGALTPEQRARLGGEIGDDELTAARRLVEGIVQAADAEVPTPRLERARGVQALGDPAVLMNFRTVNTDEELRAMIARTIEESAGTIDQARRGVQSHEETKRLAAELGLDVNALLRRARGPVSAEESLAFRQILNGSTVQLMAAMRGAMAAGAGPTEQFAFRRALAMHYAIQTEVIAARTETARALNAWAIPVGGDVEAARAVNNALEMFGGAATSQEIARRMALMVQMGVNPRALSRFVEKAHRATAMDVIREVYVNGLLWNPRTHVVNLTSNASVIYNTIQERFVAERLGSGVAAGEAAAMTHALTASLYDAFRLGFRALRTEESQFGGSAASAGRQIDAYRGHTHSLTATRLGLDEAGAIGHGIDALGTLLRIPTRTLMGSDEIFKTLAYRMEVHAQALRQATSEGLTGQAHTDRMRQLINEPPETIRLEAFSAAHIATFTERAGEMTQAIMKLRSSAGLFGVLLLAFVRTPGNIVRYSFERSALAPLIGRWRADLAAGGARRTMALTRMGLGTIVTLLAYDLADRGFITGRGPDDPGERENLRNAGWQPWSVWMGGRWWEYRRADPLALNIGVAANIAEAFRRAQVEGNEVDAFHEVMAGAIAAVSSAVLSKTYMATLADFFEAMANPEMASESFVTRLLASLATTPTTAFSAVEGAIDPERSQVMDLMDAVLSRLPGLSRQVTPLRNRWGEVETNASDLGVVYDFVAPWRVSRRRESPIDFEMGRLNLNRQRISRTAHFGGVPINFRQWPEVYDAYVRLAGNELEDPRYGLGARDLLNAVVSGDHPLSSYYASLSDGEEGGKAAFIEDTITRFRRAAQDAILRDPEFAEFRAFWEVERRRRDIETAPYPVPEPAASGVVQ